VQHKLLKFKLNLKFYVLSESVESFLTAKGELTLIFPILELLLRLYNLHCINEFTSYCI